jgi:CheY-like chemotaxis protein
MDGEKRKILIVDDDSFLLDMYALKFSQNNFEVHTAGNGKMALEKLRGGLNPDVMLVDIIMPEMDGFEVLSQISAENLCSNCVRVILSNRSAEEDIEKGKALGCSGYIVKASSTPAEVIDQVVKILQNKSVEKPA